MSTIMSAQGLNLWYSNNQALYDVNMELPKNQITALIGPSGCGKSTFLKTLNRMNDLEDGIRIEGKILYDGQDIYDPQVDTTWLRKEVGMVFQKPNPFPMSVYDNIAYGPKLQGIRSKVRLETYRLSAIACTLSSVLTRQPNTSASLSVKENTSENFRSFSLSLTASAASVISCSMNAFF